MQTAMGIKYRTRKFNDFTLVYTMAMSFSLEKKWQIYS